MKREQRNRLLIAWALLLAILPMSIVKTVHFHDTEALSAYSHYDDDYRKNTAADTCLICHFCLSDFIETLTSIVDGIAEYIISLVINIWENIEQVVTSDLFLRGPPAVSSLIDN